MSTGLPQTLQGITCHYKGNGRKLGYPTANIESATELADGVYFGHASLSDYQWQPAIIFIGTPTTMGDTERRVETYLLDITDKDYYELPLAITIEKFHRFNKTFDSVEALLSVMENDEQQARTWFKTAATA